MTNAILLFYTGGVFRLAAVWGIILALTAHAAEKKEAANLPHTKSNIEYLCHKVRDDLLRIDADPNDELWRRASPMIDFQTAGPNPKAAKYASTARLLWSDKRLFLAFKCKTDGIHSMLNERDADIWKEECAQIFLCPRGAEGRYYEIDFNPQNNIYDSLLGSYRYEEQVKHARQWALSYNAHIQSATRIQRDPQGRITVWTLEAAIPFVDLAEAQRVPPEKGDVWLFNVFRVAQVNASTCENSAWVPTEADFHKPWRFPRLRFVP